eukprot:tig00020563_g11343.t1
MRRFLPKSLTFNCFAPEAVAAPPPAGDFFSVDLLRMLLKKGTPRSMKVFKHACEDFASEAQRGARGVPETFALIDAMSAALLEFLPLLAENKEGLRAVCISLYGMLKGLVASFARAGAVPEQYAERRVRWLALLRTLLDLDSNTDLAVVYGIGCIRAVLTMSDDEMASVLRLVSMPAPSTGEEAEAIAAAAESAPASCSYIKVAAIEKLLPLARGDSGALAALQLVADGSPDCYVKFAAVQALLEIASTSKDEFIVGLAIRGRPALRDGWARCGLEHYASGTVGAGNERLAGILVRPAAVEALRDLAKAEGQSRAFNLPPGKLKSAPRLDHAALLRAISSTLQKASDVPPAALKKVSIASASVAAFRSSLRNIALPPIQR